MAGKRAREECVICLNDITRPVVLDCGHQYDMLCLRACKISTCPLCRKPFDKKKVFDLDINQPGYGGATALYLAVVNDHVPIVKTLLNNGADVNQAVDGNKLSPLQAAALSGTSELVQLLLSYGATVDYTCRSGYTALYHAVLLNRVQTVKILLSSGANPNIVGSNQQTMLHAAVSAGNIEILRELLRYDAETDQGCAQGHTPLYHCVLKNDVQMTTELLQAGADVDTTGPSLRTPLLASIFHKRGEITKILLDTGLCDVNKGDLTGVTPLAYAVENQDLELVTALIARDADVKRKTLSVQLSPIHLAAKMGNCDILEALLGAGADPNEFEPKVAPIHCAAEAGHPRVVKLLLDRGARINEKSYWFQETALHIAASKGNAEVVTELINY